LENIGSIDSKYRFVILAAKRAKQLLRGAKPKVKAKSKNLIRIAQSEVRSGLIEFEIIPAQMDEILDRDDRALGGDELVVGIAEPEDVSAKADEGEPIDEEEDEEEEESEEEADEDSSEDDAYDLKDE
jgi:DNA-directed RNA polymerase omega subunit